jgi:quercetin dioxygenase-like cupin family protein
MIKHFLGIERKQWFGAGWIKAIFQWAILGAGAPTAAITSETLLQTSSGWDNAPYTSYPEGAPELTVRKITIPAGGELTWHAHPMPNAAYILSGEITVEDANSIKRHFSAGQVIPEIVDAPHRGVIGAKPAVFIVFYAGVKGMPLSLQKQ